MHEYLYNHKYHIFYLKSSLSNGLNIQNIAFLRVSRFILQQITTNGFLPSVAVYSLIKMEEKSLVKSLTLLYQSQTLNWLKAQLYDFEDTYLQAIILKNGQQITFPLISSLTNFYFRITNEQKQICQLFSYFWPENMGQEQHVNISEVYTHFMLKIQIVLQSKTKQGSFSNKIQEQQDQVLIGRVGMYLQKVKERAFKLLQKEQFFKAQNNNYRCNFIRKKNYKNHTTVLVKNSSNILKTINQNINKSATLKSIKQIKTQDTNQSSNDLYSQLPPLAPVLKKASSSQNPLRRQEDGLKSIFTPFNYQQTWPLPRQKKVNACIKEPTIKKSSLLFKCKRHAYLKHLQTQTMLDLKNQQQTLTIIHSYIQESNKV